VNETVVAIDYSDAEYEFVISTNNHRIIADRVLCAIDPYNFRALKGNVARTIQSAKEFKMILPKQLAIVTAWWRERWWERSNLSRNSSLSRVVSHENCFNTMDIPTFPYGRNQNVTRAVYDDGACVETWSMLANPAKKQLLNKTVVSSLQKVFTDIVVPYPYELHIYVHENAWHFQKSDSNVSNSEIFTWSQNPLLGNPKFSLIGEGYNLDFTAWCDGALKSTMHVLARFYDFEFPCLNDTGSPAKCPNSTQETTSHTLHVSSSFLFD
jgi:hypothetical protein